MRRILQAVDALRVPGGCGSGGGQAGSPGGSAHGWGGRRAETAVHSVRAMLRVSGMCCALAVSNFGGNIETATIAVDFGVFEMGGVMHLRAADAALWIEVFSVGSGGFATVPLWHETGPSRHPLSLVVCIFCGLDQPFQLLKFQGTSKLAAD